MHLPSGRAYGGRQHPIVAQVTGHPHLQAGTQIRAPLLTKSTPVFGTQDSEYRCEFIGGGLVTQDF